MTTNWTTKLVITRSDTGEVITPISSFTPVFVTPFTVLHSLEADNVGVVRQPFTFTFTMTVIASGPVVADLTQLAVNGTSFNIQAAEQTGTDWTFNSILLSSCYIISTNPSDMTFNTQTNTVNPPLATFKCIALSVSATV
jgi:hypothetical protein